MIIIADSGGSKTDWRLIQKDSTILQANGPGFNPYYQTPDGIYAKLQEELIPKLNLNEPVSDIYFYGGIRRDRVA